MDKKIIRAKQIATDALRSCYRRNGIFAGNQHFTEYWGHDGFFASFGAMRLGDTDIVKKHLELFLKYQDFKTGQIPIRIGRKSMTPKLILQKFGVKMPFQEIPKYKVDRLFGIDSHKAVDSSSLLLIASANYILRSKDKAFALKYLDNFENIIKFNQSISTGNIVWQHNYSSWLDSIRKEGYSLYPTVCSYKAAISLSEIYRYIGKLDRADKYSLLAEQIKTAINSKFWNGNYYNDLYNDDGKLWTNFTSDGNILTVYWEVADKEQSQKIFNYIEENELDRPWPIKANFPAYDSKYIYWLLRFIGIGDYQTRDTIWLWIGCLLALTEMKYDTNKAIQTLLLLSKLITENNDVYEVYEKTGKPVKRFLYESEHPFAWSAGLFLEAVSEFEKYTNLSIVFS